MKNSQRENSEITLSWEVQSLLMNGGQIVIKETVGKNTTILIRMPKGKWIEDDRVKMYRNNSFEYAICRDYLTLGEITVSSYFNDTLRAAKKRAYQDHQEITWLKY